MLRCEAAAVASRRINCIGLVSYRNFEPLIATIGMVVTAAYYLITLQKVFLGETPLVYQDKAHYPDASRRELLVLVPLALVTLWMGILPDHAMNVYRHDLEGIFRQVKESASILPR